jgi:spore germination cell wall hydrolase CwlJ-like protein
VIKIRTKANFLFIFIVIALTIITIIGFMCCEHKSERTIERTIEEDKKIIDTETDKDGDTNQAVEPVTNKNKATLDLTDYERWVVECMVMGESGGESYDGQIAVAQCILNACLKENLKPSEIRMKYKYSGWHESPTNSVKKAVSAVFDEGYKITDEFILYFYAPKICNSKWHESQCHVITIGGHKFFKEWDD